MAWVSQCYASNYHQCNQPLGLRPSPFGKHCVSISGNMPLFSMVCVVSDELIGSPMRSSMRLMEFIRLHAGFISRVLWSVIHRVHHQRSCDVRICRAICTSNLFRVHQLGVVGAAVVGSRSTI